MKPEDQKIAIGGFNTAKQTVEPLPDYLNSLDAMHEVEKVLNPDQESVYWEHLLQAHEYIQPWAGTSSASQRAEAFLRTVNLWKD